MQVEQIDREAAATVAVLVEMRELIREGRADHHAEPFARHRHQARAEVVGEIVAWLLSDASRLAYEEGGSAEFFGWWAADQIEAKFGGHDAE